MYLITDTKETDPNLIREQFKMLVDTVNQTGDPSLFHRIIPQI